MTQFVIAMIILIFTISIGIPISYSMGITGLLYILITNPSYIVIVPNRLFAGIDQFQLLSIPFFLMAADIMVHSDISGKLFQFVKLFVGRFRGGLAFVNVIVSTIFGSISGTALGDVAALGKIEMNEMDKEGYNPDFSCALTAASSMQSPLVPPSNIAVLYASVMGISVGAMFLAGLLPGVLLGISQILYILFIRKKRHFPASFRSFTKEQAVRIVIDGIITMGMPVIIIGGTLGGFFTPTEAANIACVYSLILGFIVYRDYHIKDFYLSMQGIARQMANIFMIISFASVFAWVMGMEKIPDAIAAFMLSVSDNKYILLLLVNVFLLIVGMWMDTGAAIILFAPIIAPVLYQVGIHPIHFATLMLVNLTLGLITPPVGVVLYSACSVGKRRFENVVKELVPFIVFSFAVLLLVTYIPAVSTILPKMFGFLD